MTGPRPRHLDPIVLLLSGLALASVLSSLLTLLVPDLLRGPPVMNGSAKGTALVILVVAVPALAMGGVSALRGSVRGLVLAVGAAAYLAYNAVLLVLATPVNRAFLVYEAMLSLGLWAVVVLCVRTWRAMAGVRVVALRGVAAYLAVVVLLNTVAWLARIGPPTLGGTPQDVVAGTGLTTSPVYVQDLAFWLPAFAWLALGVWRGHAPRTALAAAALWYWLFEAVGVAVDQWWGHRADPTSGVASGAAVPLFLVVAAVTIGPLLRVLQELRRTSWTPAAPPPRVARARVPVSMRSHTGRWRVQARWVGGFFVWTAGIHVGIVAADTELYRHFADGALVPGLAQTWRAVFMAQPMTWGLTLAAGEATLGLLLLSRSRRVRAVGWSGVIAFQLALMAFGWGFWLWSVPALALVVPAARSDVGTSSRRTEDRAVGHLDRGLLSTPVSTSSHDREPVRDATLVVKSPDSPSLTRRR